jgi:nitroreductase
MGYLALEASSRGFVAHAIAGFDYDKARKDLDIPDGYDVMSMIAIGIRDQKRIFLQNSRRWNLLATENH